MAEENDMGMSEESPLQLTPPPPIEDEGVGGAPEWMCTFSDLVTLLMCFFVLLFAMSTIQEETFKELIQSMKTALGVEQIPETGTREGLVMRTRPSKEKKETTQAVDELGGMVQKEMNEIVSDVKELILFNKLGGQVRVEATEDGVVITISDLVLFSPGSAVLSREGLDIMAKISRVLAQFSYPIKVAGHTDNIPIHTEKYASNWELSASRASDVVRFLISEGIDPFMLSAAGLAEFRPVADNRTAKGRSRNRRVEIMYERGYIAKAMARGRY